MKPKRIKNRDIYSICKILKLLNMQYLHTQITKSIEITSVILDKKISMSAALHLIFGLFVKLVNYCIFYFISYLLLPKLFFLITEIASVVPEKRVN